MKISENFSTGRFLTFFEISNGGDTNHSSQMMETDDGNSFYLYPYSFYPYSFTASASTSPTFIDMKN